MNLCANVYGVYGAFPPWGCRRRRGKAGCAAAAGSKRLIGRLAQRWLQRHDAGQHALASQRLIGLAQRRTGMAQRPSRAATLRREARR